MALPAAPIGKNAQGHAVAELHGVLANLRLPVDAVDRTAERFGPATEAAIRQFQHDHELPATGAFDDATRAKIDAWFQENAPFVVRGTVIDAAGKPVPGAVVSADDVDIRDRRQQLGTTFTDSQGQYELRYGSEKFTKGDKGNADLIVRVNRGEVTIAESALLFNAPPEAGVDLRVQDSAGQALSEYERLDAAVQPVRDDIELHDLTDAPRQPGKPMSDVDFIAGDTGEDRQRIAWLVLAAKMARMPMPMAADGHARGVGEGRKGGAATKAAAAGKGAGAAKAARAAKTTAVVKGDGEPAVSKGGDGAILPTDFYGWFRLGLPTDPDALWGTAKCSTDPISVGPHMASFYGLGPFAGSSAEGAGFSVTAGLFFQKQQRESNSPDTIGWEATFTCQRDPIDNTNTFAFGARFATAFTK